ncbi:MAG: sodium:proline symporter, partial [bacterium]
KGLLLAAFLAAYMSTISTHLNWGTSYFINDFYRRFIVKEKSEKHYVSVARLMTIVFMFLSIIVTTRMTTISGVWSFVIECGAGLGLVLILRWFWWRVNAISEIVATVMPFIVYGVLYFGKYDIKFPNTLYVIVPITTIAWLITTFITKPTAESKLESFYTKVHPGGIGWNRISKKLKNIKSDKGYYLLFINWAAGIVLVYAFLFGMGKIIFGQYLSGMIFIIVGLASGLLIKRNFTKIGWDVLN